MHFLLYENHIISYDTHAITSYASHMTAFLYKSFHVKFIFILYDNYVWRNWLCRPAGSGETDFYRFLLFIAMVAILVM